MLLIIDDLSRDSVGIVEFVFVVGKDDVAAIKVCDANTATGVVVIRFSTTDLIRASSVAKATAALGRQHLGTWWALGDTHKPGAILPSLTPFTMERFLLLRQIVVNCFDLKETNSVHLNPWCGCV